VLFILFVVELSAQSFGMAVTPEVLIPIGNKAEYFKSGYGGRLAALLGLESLSWLSPRFDFSYSYIPLNMTEKAELSLFQASAGIQAGMTFGERFSLYSYIMAGAYYGTLNGPDTADDMYISLQGGGGTSFQLFNDVSLSLGAEYTSFLGTFDALSISFGVTTRLSGDGGGSVPLKYVTPFSPQNRPQSGFIQIVSIKLDTVFPVLLKYYDSHPLGTAIITNTGKSVLENVEVRAKPANYIDSAKLSIRLDKLDPGQSKSVDLYVLFNEDILGVSEGAKVITDITVSYKVVNREGTDQETVTLEILDRNALRWDDDQKIAAFVTARDEEIQRFSRNVASMAQDLYIDAISKELQLGMVLYSGMIEQGLSYVIDPSSAYKDLSDNPMAIDFVQFPRQTLYVKAGDCDDLSTTFCTLLESVGIPTAFITIPGHIYMAFQLKMDKNEVRRNFSTIDDFIFRDDGSVWVPVETTALSQGFLKAWATGARQWKKYDAEGKAGFFSTAKAWESYKPVAFSVSSIELGTPSRSDVLARFQKELSSFVGQEIAPREQSLRDRMAGNPANPKLLNSLGVLYARYGKYKEAEEQFEKAIKKSGFVPSMINLGNLNYIAANYQRASMQYKRVLDVEQENANALLGLARSEFELENFGSSKAAYQQLQRVSPELAAKFSYLGPDSQIDDASRAANVEEMRNILVWEDEE
ncbi:MAG: hypothetical protein MIO92_09405, partial [Methanosarcinaceae archaeon]|nr:hypothetical protein [Methanosarcinaceae archaeon]